MQDVKHKQKRDKENIDIGLFEDTTIRVQPEKIVSKVILKKHRTTLPESNEIRVLPIQNDDLIKITE
jgi:hypothetical protein